MASNRTKNILRAFVFCCLFLISFFSFSGIPEQPNPPHLVNDFGAFLTASEVQLLEQKLVSFNDSTSTQICIVTMANLDGYDIADFAFQLGKKWGIGQKGMNNGVLLVVAKEERKTFIATGYGVEEFLPDAICNRIVDNVINPEFKSGNFYQGLDDGTTQMMGYLTGKFKANDQTAKPKRHFSLGVIIAVFVILFILIRLFGGRGGGGGGGLMSTYMAGQILSGMMRGGGSSGFGGGGSSGGGFGGFGGGGFGGGGAGGSW